MNTNYVLFFCFVSALCGRKSVSAKLNIFAGAEGGNGTISCPFAPLSGSMKFFCKDECKAEDILIKTDEVRAQSGRYSTKYRDDSSGKGILSVAITHLIKSDSGRYRFGFGKNLVPDSYCDFEVRVVDESMLEDHSGFIKAVTEGENITFGCANTVNGEQKFLCKGDCNKEEDIIIETDKNRAQNGRHSIEYREGSVFGLHVTITEATTSDTGQYRCGYGRALSPDSYRTYTIIVLGASVPSASTPTTPTQSLSSSSGSFTPSSAFPETTEFTVPAPHSGYFLPLIVCVSLVGVMIIVLLLLHIWKTRRHVTSNSRNMELPVVYKNSALASTCEDSTKESSKD